MVGRSSDEDESYKDKWLPSFQWLCKDRINETCRSQGEKIIFRMVQNEEEMLVIKQEHWVRKDIYLKGE